MQQHLPTNTNHVVEHVTWAGLQVLVGSTTALQCWSGSNKHLQPMSRAPPPDWSPHPAQPSMVVTPLLGAGLQSHIATTPTCSYSRASGHYHLLIQTSRLRLLTQEAVKAIKKSGNITTDTFTFISTPHFSMDSSTCVN